MAGLGEGRRRPLHDEKIAGEEDRRLRMNVLLSGRPHSPVQQRDFHPKAPEHPYGSYMRNPSPTKPQRRYRSPERQFAGPRRGRRPQPEEPQVWGKGTSAPPERASFSSTVFARPQLVRSLPPGKRAPGRVSPTQMREAGAKPLHGFFLADPSHEPNFVSAMRLELPAKAVSQRHNLSEARDTMEWDSREAGDRGPFWPQLPADSARGGDDVSRDASPEGRDEHRRRAPAALRQGRRYLEGPPQIGGSLQEPFGDNSGRRGFEPTPSYSQPGGLALPLEPPDGRRKFEPPPPVLERGALKPIFDNDIPRKAYVDHVEVQTDKWMGGWMDRWIDRRNRQRPWASAVQGHAC